MLKKISCACLLALWPHSTAFCAPEPGLPADYSKHPFVRQQRSYTCGAAVLISALSYRGLFSGTEEDLLPKLGSDLDNGTTPLAIVDTARSFGLEAEYRENTSLGDLRKGLKRGDSVILDLQAWSAAVEASSSTWKDAWEDGHYVLLIGLDSDYAYFMDPALDSGYGYIPLEEMLERWHDYDVLPGRIWRHSRLAVFLRGGKPGSYGGEKLHRIY